LGQTLQTGYRVFYHSIDLELENRGPRLLEYLELEVRWLLDGRILQVSSWTAAEASLPLSPGLRRRHRLQATLFSDMIQDRSVEDVRLEILLDSRTTRP